MIHSDVTLREFLPQDAEAVRAIIREAWHYNDLCGAKAAEKLSNVFLNSCLTNQTYTQVAVKGGVPAGIIMVKDRRNHSPSLRYRLAQIRSILSLYLSREGRAVSKIFQGVNDVDRQLLNACRTDYQGELSFFAVSAEARGTGIGKLLFQSAQNYMQSRGIETFYLFTDTSYNYGFYEHAGLHRRCEMGKQFQIKGETAEMTFFLYDNLP